MKGTTKRIAVIVSDTLQSIGLQTLFSDYFAPVEIERFVSYDELLQHGSVDSFDYYVSEAETVALHSDFFLPRSSRTVLLTRQEGSYADSNALVVQHPQEELIAKLHQILTSGRQVDEMASGRELSSREIEVLRLVACGRINKEIAEILSISFQTVLTHRKNITAKLGIKTVSGLTFYALMNGYVTADQIGQ